MELIQLANGKQYTLAVNGFWASGDELALKLVTDETVEEVAGEFTKDNCTILKVVNEEGATLNQVSGYVQIGNSVTKKSNEVISVEVTKEEVDEEGTVTTPAGIKENYGTVIMFSMFQGTLETQVQQNRADIDYLLMMEGEE